MPLTTLNSKTALIVGDLQSGILSYPTVHLIVEVVGHSTARPDIHGNRISRIFPRLGETGTTQQFIDLVDGITA
jgi:hypothetical protein